MPDEEYTVSDGESVPSIAKDRGFFWKTLWDKNPELKSKRKNPNVLLAGDVLKIPELQPAEFSKPSDARHKFKRKGDPAKIKVKLLMMGEPRKNEKYILNIDGTTINGTTDGDGMLEQFVPGNAKSAILILDEGKEQHTLNIGNLDPVDEVTGIQQRLENLGHSVGGEFGEIGEGTKEALRKFQAKFKLEVTGEADAATKAKLSELSQ
ncbi:MAG: peptidoglycan-binding protein [Acidobacteriota bacterium]|nr:peptidoglycan-binding protein [Acidobacteriota bacterium]